MSLPSLTKQFLGLLGWVGFSYGLAAVGAVASVRAGAFYQQLVRPAWAPPGWLFGPVWSLLYTFMAVAAWLVWREQGLRAAAPALALFLLQLLANAIWTWLFFRWRQGAAAFAEVLLLGALILATTLAFWRVRPLAAVLLLPYLGWVSFASVLTWAIWKRNPGLLG
jgi:translocator protein